jgi:glycosyltransferase involved in cell wall biosynthesis
MSPVTGAGIALVTWANDEPTGGNIYNRRLAGALRDRGWAVDIVAVPGAWPEADGAARERLAAELVARPLTVVDGIVASHAPAAIASATAADRFVLVLVHLPLGVERPDPVEAEALRAATAILCTSRYGANLIKRHYGIRAAVALPGVEPAALAVGSRPPLLLSVASLTPIKDQLTLVRALVLISDLDWSAALVGSTSADPGYADEVRSLIDSAGLGKRIELTGTLTGAPLEEQWAAADLLLLVSRTETYGLVVTEALARGIPVVVGTGTGAEEALLGTEPVDSLPGRTVPIADPPALAAALRCWLTDADLRTAWQAAAHHRRTTLPGWAETAAAVERSLAPQATSAELSARSTDRSNSVQTS